VSIGVGRRIATGAGWTIALRLGDRLIGLVSTLILARLLVPTDFGIVAMGSTIAAVLDAVTAFGFEWALIQRRTQERRHLDTAWTLNVLIGLVNAAVLCLLIPVAISFFSEPRVADVLLVFALISAIGGLRNIGMVRFEQDLEFGPIFRVAMGARLVGFAVTIALALAYQSYWALLAGSVAGKLVDLALSYIVHTYRPRMSLSTWRELFGFSKWLLANNVLFFLSNRGTDFIVGNRAGAAALGTFNISYDLANMPTTELVQPIMRAAFPGYSQIADERVLLGQTYLRLFGLVALFTLPAAVGILCLSTRIVDVLLGPSWVAAVPLMQALAVFGGLRALQGTTNSVYLALGKPQILSALTAFYVVVGLTSFAAVLWTRSLDEAVWTLVATNALVSAGSLLLVARQLAFPASRIASNLLRPALASAAMAIAVTTLQSLLRTTDSWPLNAGQLVGLFGAGMATYGLAVLALWLLAGRPDGPERDILERAQARTQHM